MTRRTARVALTMCIALAAPITVTGLPGCGSTSQYKGDPEARKVEKLIEELNQALAEENMGRANSVARDIDNFVDHNRRELELHPEASMIFSRIDSAKRRLRQKQKIAQELAAANAQQAVEESVRQPLDQASEIAQKILQGEPKTAEVIELRKSVSAAQDALNNGRRDGKIEVGGDFANEMDARLDALRATADKAERQAQLTDARDKYREAMRAIELAEGRPTPEERLGDYESATNKFNEVKSGLARLQEADPALAKQKLELEEGKKPVRIQDVAKLCDKQLKKIGKLTAQAKKALKAKEKVAKFAADKSEDQKQLIDRFGRKPDVMSKKKGKVMWTWIERRPHKKKKKRKVKIFFEFYFDETGKLVDQNERKKM